MHVNIVTARRWEERVNPIAAHGCCGHRCARCYQRLHIGTCVGWCDEAVLTMEALVPLGAPTVCDGGAVAVFGVEPITSGLDAIAVVLCHQRQFALIRYDDEGGGIHALRLLEFLLHHAVRVAVGVAEEVVGWL